MLPRIAIAAGLVFALMLAPQARAAEGVRAVQLAQALPYGRQQAEPLPGGPEQGFLQLIPESMAVDVAMQILPDSKPLGVRLLSGDRPVYAVRLRSQGQVQRVLVDALTGEVIGQ
jgi:hypothetical protein